MKFLLLLFFLTVGKIGFTQVNSDQHLIDKIDEILDKIQVKVVETSCINDSDISLLEKKCGSINLRKNEFTGKTDTSYDISFRLSLLLKCKTITIENGQAIVAFQLKAPFQRVDVWRVVHFSRLYDGWDEKGYFLNKDEPFLRLISKISFVASVDPDKLIFYEESYPSVRLHFDNEVYVTYDDMNAQGAKTDAITADNYFIGGCTVAMVVQTEDIGFKPRIGTDAPTHFSRGLSKEEIPLIVADFRKRVEPVMRKRYRKYGDKLKYDGKEKYSLLGVNGEIINRSNTWELIELIIIYTPYSSSNGRLQFIFSGSFKNASPFKAPDEKVIRQDGTNLEDDHRAEVESYLHTLITYIENELKK